MDEIMFRSTITKDEVKAMPLAKFMGEIYLIDREEDEREAIEYLLHQNVIGLDTETKPNFQKGGMNPVALLQLSTLNKCFLFRLNKMGLTKGIESVLSSPNVKKIGLSVKDDISQLRHLRNIPMNNFVEIQSYVTKYGITDKSLMKIYGIVFGEQISKKQRLTNWAASSLTQEQQQYAALDAYATLCVYLCLEGINGKGDREKDRYVGEFKRKIADKPERDNITKIYEETFGYVPLNITPIEQAGSSRKYFRVEGKNGTHIVTIGDNIKENAAFIYLSDFFKSENLSVPVVYSSNKTNFTYIQEDLGETTLFDIIKKESETGKYSKKTIAILNKIVRTLPYFQFPKTKLDWSKCYPEASFSTTGLFEDFQKFTKYILDAIKYKYNKELLRRDIEAVVEVVMKTKSKETWGFMYRDFQSRNIMMKNGTPYMIDFQGGRQGPLWYDIVSFVFQSRASYPVEVREYLLSSYFDELQKVTNINEQQFYSKLPLFVFVRMIQVLGTYGLRGTKEQKSIFMGQIPKTLSTIKPLLDTFTPMFPYLCRVLGDLISIYVEKDNSKLVVSVNSFSYKKGIPEDKSGNGGGYVFDCRYVHNPGRYEKYKSLTGLDDEVIEFLERDGEITDFLNFVYAIADKHVNRYIERGFTNLQFSFGCTGGQHRSVYAAQHLAERINRIYGVKVELEHREQNIKSIFERKNIDK